MGRSLTMTEKLIRGNEEFVNRMLQEDPDYFSRLRQGQNPEIFLLACCDSRVSPSIITGMLPGNMFVHRNIANQALETDPAFTASLHFALKNLKVKQIIVKGHTGCGGITAAREEKVDPEMEGWIREVRNSLPDPEAQPDLTPDELSRLNVLHQVKRLKEHPVYREHGWGVKVDGILFHLESGRLELLT